MSARGDSYFLLGLRGLTGPLENNSEPLFESYVGQTDPKSKVLSPLYSDLHGLPPTLFLSTTRDLLLSGTAALDRAFINAGVPAQMVIFEPLPHGFWNNPTLPEFQEADRIIAKLFTQHLGKRSATF